MAISAKQVEATKNTEKVEAAISAEQLKVANNTEEQFLTGSPSA